MLGKDSLAEGCPVEQSGIERLALEVGQRKQPEHRQAVVALAKAAHKKAAWVPVAQVPVAQAPAACKKVARVPAAHKKAAPVTEQVALLKVVPLVELVVQELAAYKKVAHKRELAVELALVHPALVQHLPKATSRHRKDRKLSFLVFDCRTWYRSCFLLHFPCGEPVFPLSPNGAYIATRF